LIANLQAVPSTEAVANPYNAPGCARNLAVYFEALVLLPYSGHLLVGEALGYRGGALTGIPFTSPRLLRNPPHSFFKNLQSELVVPGDIAEPTATVVWSTLETSAIVPACWNVFPFHPHRSGERASNRAPSSDELADGRSILDLVLDILAPHTLIAVGRVAEKALERWYPEMRPLAVRHPSHGGKTAFAAGLKAAGIA
jgi:uracil-DNA glycosylase